MEIKQGDRVKVLKDAPKVYLSSVNNLFKYHVCKVEETDGDSAKIRYTDIGIDRWLAIPTKYLYKVNAEPKNEPKFKVGDFVQITDCDGFYRRFFRIDKIIGDEAIIHCVNFDEPPTTISLNRLVRVDMLEFKHFIEGEPTPSEPEKPSEEIKVGDKVEELVSRMSGRVLGIEGDFVVVGIPYDKEKHYWHIDSVELVEPTEQTEAEKKSNVGSIKIPVEADLTDSFWDAYAADLAKEIALKVANKYNDPKEAAEYAVSVAKAVVEGLKSK